MSERMQVYIRYCNEGNTKIWARDFSWCFGSRAISRARYTIEYIIHNFKYNRSGMCEKLLHILETNFDFVDYMKTTDIISEWRKFHKDASFTDMIENYANDDGYLFIDVNTQKDFIHYAFAWNEDIYNPLTAEDYMEACYGSTWEISLSENETDIEPIYENIEFLNTASKEYKKDVRIMSDEELKTFVSSLEDDITADRVTVSLATLWELNNGGNLQYTHSPLYIRYTKDDNGNEYFDLIDKYTNKIILCDGEEVSVAEIRGNYAILETEYGDTITLTLYEYANAVFSC